MMKVGEARFTKIVIIVNKKMVYILRQTIEMQDRDVSDTNKFQNGSHFRTPNGLTGVKAKIFVILVCSSMCVRIHYVYAYIYQVTYLQYTL